MESLPTEQNDIEKLNAEPATGPGVLVAPPEPAASTPSPVTQNPPPPVVQTPQPQFDPPVATPLNAPKKSHKKRTIIIAVVILLLLTAGAVAAVMLFSIPKKDTAKKSTAETTKPLDDAQGIVTKINTAITDTSKDMYQNPQVSFTSPTSAQPAVSPSYQVKNTDYYVVTNQAYGLNIQKTVDTNSETGVDTVFTQGIMDQVTATLVGNKYSKTTELASGVEYQSDAVVCTVSGTDGIPIYVICANKNAYTKASSDLKPLVTAYRASNPDSDPSTVYSLSTIRSSSVDGYQNAVVSIGYRQRNGGGGGAFFYRKESGDWKFFKQSQSAFDCSEFNTDDLKAAFADESCTSDANTATTVKDYVPGTKKTSGSSNTGSTSTSDTTTKNDTTYNSGAASSSTNP